MVALEIYIIKHSIQENSIGVQEEIEQEIMCPIIKHEDIYSNEFYEANQAGLKPELRLRISALNYDNEKEIKYNGIRYSVIRTSVPNLDEIILICERKVGNGN